MPTCAQKRVKRLFSRRRDHLDESDWLNIAASSVAMAICCGKFCSAGISGQTLDYERCNGGEAPAGSTRCYSPKGSGLGSRVP